MPVSMSRIVSTPLARSLFCRGRYGSLVANGVFIMIELQVSIEFRPSVGKTRPIF
jgi:hypothetical protein